ncbi:MAG: hypothetical protein IPG92_01420 [Flavobacteriales bacterium]|nr:hypothetical protein [Flavobacteriales bacterium]
MQRYLALVFPFLLSFTVLCQAPTWSDDVACIVFTHCAPCHHEGGPGHFNLTSYVDGYWWRNEMRDATQARFMPPWPPDPNYRSLAHERVLTQSEIDMIAAWVDGGAMEGDPQNAPAPPIFTSNAQITDPDISLIMEDYAVPASTTDNYRCFVLPTNTTVDSYITGLEVIPGNTEMVHHVLVFQDTTGEASTLDAADIEPGYTSFGGIGVDAAKLVGVWAPGASAYFTPPGMGLKLLAGADIVIQIHYPSTSSVEIDSTRINIELAPPGFQRELSLDPILDHVVTITDGPLLIAPNVVDTFHAQYTTPIPATLAAIAPHSHLLGKRMKAWAVKPGGEVVPLIDIPDWDFRWQGLYSFRRPLFFPQGTTLHCETIYDNTDQNPDNPNDPPNWVWLGEATTNEMMLYYFMWTYGFAADENIVVDDSPHMEHYLDCDPEFTIGWDAESPAPAWSIWPSPARTQVTVSTIAADAELRMIDVSGRLAKRERIRSGVQDIDVASLARGLYTVELLARNAPPQRTKVLLE